MEQQNNSQNYNVINRHLESRTGVIAIVQGSNKFAKPWATNQRFNWTKQDVLKQAPGGIEEFIKSLVNHGYSNGAKLIIRNMEGSSAKTKGEIELFFPNTPQAQTPNTSQQVIEAPKQTTQQMETPPVPQQQQPVQQMAAPVVALGYTQVLNEDWVNLKVKSERNSELKEKLLDLKTQIEDTKAELRIEKQKSYDAERKLETIQDRCDIKIERIEAGKKTILDNEKIMEGLGTLLGRAPEMIDSFKPKPPTTGLGNPLQGFTAVKQQFIGQIQPVQDEYIPILSNTLIALLKVDGYAEKVMSDLENIIPNTEQDG